MPIFNQLVSDNFYIICQLKYLFKLLKIINVFSDYSGSILHLQRSLWSVKLYHRQCVQGNTATWKYVWQHSSLQSELFATKKWDYHLTVKLKTEAAKKLENDDIQADFLMMLLQKTSIIKGKLLSHRYTQNLQTLFLALLGFKSIL